MQTRPRSLRLSRKSLDSLITLSLVYRFSSTFCLSVLKPNFVYRSCTEECLPVFIPPEACLSLTILLLLLLLSLLNHS